MSNPIPAKKAVKEADVLILECNRHTEMLRAGRYPWNVKRRILGDLGHLSNELAAEALVGSRDRKIAEGVFGPFEPRS